MELARIDAIGKCQQFDALRHIYNHFYISLLQQIASGFVLILHHSRWTEYPCRPQNGLVIFCILPQSAQHLLICGPCSSKEPTILLQTAELYVLVCAESRWSRTYYSWQKEVSRPCKMCWRAGIHFWPHISNMEEREKCLWQGRSFDELEERGPLRKGEGFAVSWRSNRRPTFKNLGSVNLVSFFWLSSRIPNVKSKV